MNFPSIQTLKVALYKGSADYGLAFLRLSTGVLMFRHGYDKLINFPEITPDFPDPFGIGNVNSLALAIFAEAMCSILVCAGLMTRLALVPLIVTMLVAVLVAHAGDPFAMKEMALSYLLTFTSLLIAGPGKISLDYLLVSKSRSIETH